MNYGIGCGQQEKGLRCGLEKVIVWTN